MDARIRKEVSILEGVNRGYANLLIYAMFWPTPSIRSATIFVEINKKTFCGVVWKQKILFCVFFIMLIFIPLLVYKEITLLTALCRTLMDNLCGLSSSDKEAKVLVV